MMLLIFFAVCLAVFIECVYRASLRPPIDGEM